MLCNLGRLNMYNQFALIFGNRNMYKLAYFVMGGISHLLQREVNATKTYSRHLQGVLSSLKIKAR